MKKWFGVLGSNIKENYARNSIYERVRFSVGLDVKWLRGLEYSCTFASPVKYVCCCRGSTRATTASASASPSTWARPACRCPQPAGSSTAWSTTSARTAWVWSPARTTATAARRSSMRRRAASSYPEPSSSTWSPRSSVSANCYRTRVQPLAQVLTRGQRVAEPVAHAVAYLSPKHIRLHR